MLTNRRSLLAASLALVAAGPRIAFAHGYDAGNIQIVHPWTYEHAKIGDSQALVGMELRNKGRFLDRLTGVEARDGAKAELRGASIPKSGKGKPGIAILPGLSIDLHAKGPHIFVSDIKRTLVAYDSLPLTLIFERAGRIEIEVTVEERTS